MRSRVRLLSIILLAGLLGAGVKWGIPAAAERVVASLPSSADQKVGDVAQAELAKTMFKETRLSDQLVAEVGAIFDEVQPAKTRTPLRLLIVATEELPNALALPNGTIVMTDEMILHILGKEPTLYEPFRYNDI